MDPFEEPFPIEEAALSPRVQDIFGSESDVKGSHSSLHSSPGSPEKGTGTLEALRTKISVRTAALDASSKEKEKEIEGEAKNYIQAKKAEHDAAVAAARAENRKLQVAKAEKLKEHKKSDAIWRNIGIMLDLSKPNKFSKNTERMRNVFLTMTQNNSGTTTS